MRWNRPVLKAIHVFAVGVLLAITLSTLITLPYLSAWWNLHQQQGHATVLQVAGETHMEYQPDAYVNVTLIAVYPQAAVEARSGMFVTHLFFHIVLNSNITDFVCDEVEVNFRSSDNTQTCFSYVDLRFSDEASESFSRTSSSGGIQPFLANVSLSIDAGRWPPHYGNTSSLLYLAGQIDTFPDARLAGKITVNNASFGFFSVLFEMDERATTLYRFNWPPTLWLTYGASAIIIAAVSLNLSRQPKKHDTDLHTSKHTSGIPAPSTP